MLSLSSTDAVVYSGLALIGLSGLWLPYLRDFRIPWPAAGKAPAADWKTETVETLIRLQATLDEKQMTPASKLCRELIWQILGGDPK